MSADIISEAIRPSFPILRPWDTILEEPQLRPTTSNRLRLPPPTFAQHDRETRGPPKVIKSHDQRFHTSFSSSTISSHKLQHKHQFFHRLPMDVAIRCSTPNCSCDCFAPGKTQMRICANCNHGWISHAMDNLGFSHLFNSHTTIENFQANSAFDISSLILYGTHALPVRLKILLDRVLCTLDHDELLHLLHGFGWTYDDYSRGYMLQDSCGNLFSRWAIISKEEELLVLQLFLRFTETKNIAQNFVLQDTSPFEQFLSNSAIFPNKRDSDIRKFIERTNKSPVFTNIRQSTNLKHSNNTENDVNSRHSSANTVSLKMDSFQKQIGSSSSILQPISPSDKKLSPVNSHSPSALSPLNKLQNMQPFDYRKSDTTSKMASMSADIPISYAQSTTPTSSSPTTSSFSYISSGLPLVTTAITTNHVSSISTNMTSTTNSDLSVSDGLSDEDSNISGAINLSQTSSAYALKKVKHLRKSANPMKRRWNPMVLSGLTTNPSTGKKRVQCHVCLKTFCDKGALKIHFSAVHLREMHKCTVEGCNMMFSSRRSRNRHSANPNPKLHTPNFRRKVNPHDGRSANPYPLVPPTSSSSILNLTGNSLMGQNIDSSGLLESENLSSEFGHNISSNKNEFNLDHERDSLSPNSSCHSPDTESLPAMLSINKTVETTEKMGNKSENNSKNGSPEEGINLSLKDEIANNKGVRKRKSLNPIKFAPMPINASDDEMRYITSDDSSSDTYIDRIDDDDNALIDDSKSEDYDSSNGMLCANDSKGEELENTIMKEKRKKIENEDIEYDIDGTIDLSKKRTSTQLSHDDRKHRNRSEASFASKMSSAITTTESVMENPLRHLESLSLGSFANLVNPRNQRNSLFSSNSVHSLSFHSPCLGMSVRPPTPPTHQPISKSYDRENNSNKESESGIQNAGNANAVPSGLDIDSCIGDHVSLLPAFREASFVGQVEVPVDKENPRRCTACGKIFQNHFGVKTHYQNVHLKLMHKCTVDGCNASFPSKRSRDRHSANLNLHRKLLSTHSEGKSGFQLEKANTSAMFPFHPSAALRDDIFSRLYDPQGLPLSLGDLYSRLPPLGPDGLFAASAAAAAAVSFPVVPGFHPAMCLPPPPPPNSSSLYLDTRSSVSRESPNSVRTTPSPSLNNRSSPPKSHRISSPLTNVVLEASFVADETGRYVCNFCQRSKSDANGLRDHYQRVHRDALQRCCVHGCNRVFLDKKAKKRHILFHSPPNNRDNSPL